MKKKHKVRQFLESDIKVENTVDEPSKKSRLFSLKRNWLMILIIGIVTLGAFGAGLKYLEEDAQREVARRNASKSNLNNQEESFLNKINPFLPTPTLSATPQLSKEYLYAGGSGRLLAVEDANANAAPPADLAIWRPSNGQWWVMGGNGSQQVTQSWGANGDDPVPGDYDGDGKTDFAVFRPDNPVTTSVNECQSNCQWYLIFSSTGASIQFGFGAAGDKPVPADYDGDGKTDVAVFRNSNATWYINLSSNATTVFVNFGLNGDRPAPADFDGDGRADAAVFRESSGRFYSLNSTNLQTQDTLFGAAGDKPVPADYDGDGRADVAFWRSGNASWYIRQSSDSSTQTIQFGIGTDTPVQNDYDGDGKVDLAVWRGTASPSPGGDVGRWLIRNSGNPGNVRQEQWGIAGDIPVPAFWKRQ